MNHPNKTWAHGLTVLAALGTLAMANGCSSDPYDTGDGRYSYLQADFGMAHATTAKTADYIVTDHGDTVRFAKPAAASWLPAQDTLCRALVYYDVKTRRVFTLSQVLVAHPADKANAGNAPTDPLTIESVWPGGGFINIGFAVKTGSTDALDARQSIGIMVDTIETEGDSVRAVTLRMLHGQNQVPEYYTVKGYLSTPLPPEWRNARLTVKANGYQGEQTLTVR